MLKNNRANRETSTPPRPKMTEADTKDGQIGFKHSVEFSVLYISRRQQMNEIDYTTQYCNITKMKILVSGTTHCFRSIFYIRAKLQTSKLAKNKVL